MLRPIEVYLALKGNPRISRFLTPAVRFIWRFWRDSRRWLPLGSIPVLRTWSGRPAGTWPTADDYLAHHPEGGSIRVVFPAGSQPRQKPLDLSVGRDLPHGSAAPVSWPPGRIMALNGVRLIGGYSGSVVTPDNKLIAELSPDVWTAERHELFSRIRTPRGQSLAGLTAMIATPEAPENYSHWLFDLLPRIILLEKGGIQIADIDHFVINLGGSPFCQATLQAMGLPLEKIRPLDRKTAYRAERMVSSSLRAEHWQSSLSPAILQGLAGRLSRVAQPDVDFPKRLYLSRSKAKFRRLVNESEIEGALGEAGFAPFFPEKYSFAEQVAAFKNADLIVSPHSSALCNLMFCRPGTPVLELFPPNHGDFSFWTVASHCGLPYAAIRGEPVDVAAERSMEDRARGMNKGTRYLDYRIDPAKFRAGLDDFLELARVASGRISS